MVSYLIDRLKAPFFNTYNQLDEDEHVVVMKKGHDNMEDLNAPHEDLPLPNLTQYGVCLPFRVAVVGQTNSGKTHSIMHRWLGGKISF